LEWYEKDLAISEELGDRAGLATSYNNIGMIHNAREDYATATEWLEKSLAIFEEIGAVADATTVRENLEGVRERMASSG
jgi:tetratricopeptide (TPR) repeat protein